LGADSGATQKTDSARVSALAGPAAKGGINNQKV
jgi:hypothetical protein